MVRLTSYLMKYIPKWMNVGIMSHTSDKRFVRKMKLFQITQCYGHRSRDCYKLTRNYFARSLRLAQKKRAEKYMFMKDLYSQRIWAALQEHRFPYKYFFGVLPRCGIELDRKMLAHLAIWEPRTFASLVEVCKAKVTESPEGEFDSEIEKSSRVITRKLL